MDKIISVKEPDNNSSLYTVEYKDENDKSYFGVMTKKAYTVARLKDQMRIYKYDMKLIEEFKNAVYDLAYESIGD